MAECFECEVMTYLRPTGKFSILVTDDFAVCAERINEWSAQITFVAMSDCDKKANKVVPKAQHECIPVPPNVRLEKLFVDEGEVVARSVVPVFTDGHLYVQWQESYELFIDDVVVLRIINQRQQKLRKSGGQQ